MVPAEYGALVEALTALRHAVADWAIALDDDNRRAAGCLRRALEALDAASRTINETPVAAA